MKKNIIKSPLSAYLSDPKEIKKGEKQQTSIIKTEEKVKVRREILERGCPIE